MDGKSQPVNGWSPRQNRPVGQMGGGSKVARQALDQWLRAANADWDAIAGTRNPNGDADLANELVTGFRVVGGLPGLRRVLKSDVIFFGENVPRDRVAEARRQKIKGISIFVGCWYCG